MPVYQPSELHQLGIRPKRTLSQNFLIDQNILEKICVAAGLKEGDTVLEIGPGPGALTEKLLEKGAFVIAIEKDSLLAEKLERFRQDRLQIYCEDALTFPLEKLPTPLKVVANLPFHLTTPLLTRLVSSFPQISSLTVTIQKEVGEKILAETNSPKYGILSLFLRAYSIPKYCFSIKPTSFFPAPSVHSCVVHLKLRPFPFAFPSEPFFHLIQTAFGKGRKMLRASLKDLYPPSKLEKAAEKANISLTRRPRELTLEDFASLFRELEKD